MRHLPCPILVLLAAGGCAPDTPAPVEDEEPAPYIFPEEDAPVPTLAAADLEDAVASAVATVLDLDAAPIFPAYAAAMAGSDTGCPYYYDYQGSAYWYDQCTADGGASYSGYSFYQLYQDYDDGAGNLYNGESIYGVARIDTADGHTFEAGGSAQLLVATASTYTYYSSVIAGSFAWDGPEADGTWMAEGLSPDVTMVGYVVPAYGNYMQVDGGVSGLGGDLDTVVFDAVTIFEESLGSTCPTEPGGVISVRDADGNWYDVVFDGPADYGEVSDPALCDGCGSAWFRGEPLGEVCADFSALLDWEGSPW
jgi:hypothetical protein